MKAGNLGKIIRLVSDKEYNIVSTVQIATKSGKVVIEVQIEGKVDLEEVRSLFEDAGIEVDSPVPQLQKISKGQRFFLASFVFFFLYYSSILEECDIIMYIMYEEALMGTNIEITMDMERRIGHSNIIGVTCYQFYHEFLVYITATRTLDWLCI